MKTTLRKLTAAWPVAIFLLFPALARGETAVQAWVQSYNGPGNGTDYARAVAMDDSNNVIITGYSVASGGHTNYATIKYSSAGLPLWTNRYVGSANSYDKAVAVVVDRNNDVIVTGSSYGGASGLDYATVKYSSVGVAIWTNRYNGPGDNMDEPWAVAVDGNNDVILTGRSYSSVNQLSSDYATIKYSSAGVPLWTNRYNGLGNSDDGAVAVAADNDNNVVVTGHSRASALGNPDYATIKYSSDGVALWTNRYNGPGNSSDSATALAVDGNNSVIVTGISLGSVGSDYATVKYSNAGLPLWTNLYSGPGNNPDWPYAVAVDGNNDIVVTGYSYSSFAYVSSDFATVKYSSAGVPLWTNRYNGSGNNDDRAIAVAVDGNNNVIVTGCSYGNGTSYDYATIKYSSAGAPVWTNRYNGPGNGEDWALGVVADKSNNAIVTGFSAGSGSSYDFATIKYICVPEPVLIALPPTTGAFQLRVDDLLQPGTLVIEACTNLADWAPVFTNTTPSNVLFYTDPEAGTRPARFYRAFQSP